MIFLDCPAHLDDTTDTRCGLPAHVRCAFTMDSTDGPIEGVMIRCPSGHWFNGPRESMLWHEPEGTSADAALAASVTRS